MTIRGCSKKGCMVVYNDTFDRKCPECKTKYVEQG